jgi:hypothetical protein
MVVFRQRRKDLLHVLQARPGSGVLFKVLPEQYQIVRPIKPFPAGVV